VPDETDQLEASDTWDWAVATKRPGVPEAGVTVSVDLTSAEFEDIAQCAQHAGLGVTDFIRAVVLKAARGRTSAR
jgi:hypothetical protein